MEELKQRKRSKTRFTATHRKARYKGNHPHLIDTTGVYYFSKEQECDVYRPDSLGKADWYRVYNSSLEILE